MKIYFLITKLLIWEAFLMYFHDIRSGKFLYFYILNNIVKIIENKQKLGDWIKEKYNFDLPIEKGGSGTKDNPFIVKYVQPNDYIGAEYALVKYLYEYLNEEILDNSQAFISHEGRKYDKLTVSSRDPETQEIGYRELYFDITDGIGK